MATTVLLDASWTTASGSKSATGSPEVGDHILIFAAHTGNATQVAPTDNQGGTYTLVNTTTKGGGADRFVCYVRDQAITDKINTTFTHNPGATTGGGIAVFATSGMSKFGSASIKQSAVKAQTAAGNTPSVTFGSAVLTTNPVITCYFNQSNPAGLGPNANYTERFDLGYATPVTGFEGSTRDSGETGTTISYAAVSATIHCGLGVELDSSASSGGQVKYWDGSSWVLKPMKYWNGSAWVEKPVKAWNGSSWVVA